MNAKHQRGVLGCLLAEHVLILLVLSFPQNSKPHSPLYLGLVLAQIALIATWQAVGRTPTVRRWLIAGILYSLLILMTGYQYICVLLIALMATAIHIPFWFQKRRGFYLQNLCPGKTILESGRIRFRIMDLLLLQFLTALLVLAYHNALLPRDAPYAFFRYTRMVSILMPFVIMSSFIVSIATWVILSPEKYVREASNNYASIIGLSLFLVSLVPDDRMVYLAMQFFTYSSLFLMRYSGYRIMGPPYHKKKLNWYPSTVKSGYAAK